MQGRIDVLVCKETICFPSMLWPFQISKKLEVDFG